MSTGYCRATRCGQSPPPLPLSSEVVLCVQYGCDISPNIHTSADTMSIIGFSWEHLLEFVKLAMSFVYELAI